MLSTNLVISAASDWLHGSQWFLRVQEPLPPSFPTSPLASPIASSLQSYAHCQMSRHFIILQSCPSPHSSVSFNHISDSKHLFKWSALSLSIMHAAICPYCVAINPPFSSVFCTYGYISIISSPFHSIMVPIPESDFYKPGFPKQFLIFSYQIRGMSSLRKSFYPAGKGRNPYW